MFTARKGSLGQGNIFTSVCQEFCSGGEVLSQHALQVASQHALQQVSREVLSQHALQVVSQHALQQVSGGSLLWRVSAPGGSAPKGGCLVEAPRTAAAVGSTHPTGMYSCFISVCLFTRGWGITGPMSFPGVGYLWSHVLSRGVGYLWSHVPSGVGEYTLP